MGKRRMGENQQAGGSILTSRDGSILESAKDYVHINRLETAEQVLEQLPIWFEDYNEIHPHQGLKMRSPREYRKSLIAASGCPV